MPLYNVETSLHPDDGSAIEASSLLRAVEFLLETLERSRPPTLRFTVELAPKAGKAIVRWHTVGPKGGRRRKAGSSGAYVLSEIPAS